MNYKKYAVALVVVFSASFLLYRGYSKVERQVKRSKYFSYEKIATTKDWVQHAPLFSEDGNKVKEILLRPFFYLGKGKQCYAFTSGGREHGEYVIKFFQQERLEASTNQKDVEYKEERRKSILASFELAMGELQEETGLVCLHLGKTEGQFGLLPLLDERGTLFKIPLDTVPFAVQKKAALLKQVLIELMYQGKEEEAKKRIDQIFSLLKRCSEKGVEDQDGALIRNDNIGFLADKAIYIDIGKLQKTVCSARELFEKDLERLRPLEKWLEANFPVLADYFSSCRERYRRSL